MRHVFVLFCFVLCSFCLTYRQVSIFSDGPSDMLTAGCLADVHLWSYLLGDTQKVFVIL